MTLSTWMSDGPAMPRLQWKRSYYGAELITMPSNLCLYSVDVCESYHIDLFIFSKALTIMELHSRVLLLSTYFVAFTYKLQPIVMECTH